MSKNKFNTFKYLIRALVFIVGFITIFWYVLFDPPVTQFELDSQDTIWSSPLTIHTSGNKKGLMSLWVKNNIFTNRGYFYSSPDLVASGGKVFIIGSTSSASSCKFFAMN